MRIIEAIRFEMRRRKEAGDPLQTIPQLAGACKLPRQTVYRALRAGSMRTDVADKLLEALQISLVLPDPKEVCAAKPKPASKPEPRKRHRRTKAVLAAIRYRESQVFRGEW